MLFGVDRLSISNGRSVLSLCLHRVKGAKLLRHTLFLLPLLSLWCSCGVWNRGREVNNHWHHEATVRALLETQNSDLLLAPTYTLFYPEQTSLVGDMQPVIRRIESADGAPLPDYLLEALLYLYPPAEVDSLVRLHANQMPDVLERSLALEKRLRSGERANLLPLLKEYTKHPINSGHRYRAALVGAQIAQEVGEPQEQSYFWEILAQTPFSWEMRAVAQAALSALPNLTQASWHAALSKRLPELTYAQHRDAHHLMTKLQEGGMGSEVALLGKVSREETGSELERGVKALVLPTEADRRGFVSLWGDLPNEDNWYRHFSN